MSPSRIQIAFVTPSFPLAARNGGEVVSREVLQELASAGRVEVFALGGDREREEPNGEPTEMDGLGGTQKVIGRVYACRRRRSLLSLVNSYRARLPLSVYRNQCPARESDLQRYCRRYPHAVLVSDHWLCAETVLRARQPGQPCVLHAHNAEHVMWKRHKPKSLAGRLVVRCEAKRVERYERGLLSAFDRVVALSELDVQRLQSLGAAQNLFSQEPGWAKKLSGRLCCIRPMLDPMKGPTSWSTTVPRLLFVGTLSWPPNVQGLDAFLAGPWPAFRRRFPQATLSVVGGGLPSHLQRRFTTIPGVELLGFVEDLDSLFATSRAFVAPVIGGSGVKIKTLHALSRGLPVLTTPDGAEGVDVSGEALRTYSNSEEFVRQALTFWEDSARWKHQSSLARNEVLQAYSRNQGGEQWRQLVADLAGNLPQLFWGASAGRRAA